MYERGFAGGSLAGRLAQFDTQAMTRKDHYYNKAKQEGYRTRSAYKLKQLDEDAGLFGPGNTVVDLGAAPGGWLQVASEAVGDHGKVVGVDLQRIRDLDLDNVETVRGDMTDEETKASLRDRIGAEGADVVISDMAPNMTGEYSLDHARSIHLARQAFEVALDLLPAGGDFAVKVFDGQDLADFRADVEEEFQYVRSIRPDASRNESSEQYLVGKHRITAPVATGDELDVVIDDVGSEGDGIAKVDGYTLFVPGTEAGDEVHVRVTDLKPNFGFAELVEP
ncbi:23S rRNA Um-2552 2'-O-methyltransferase [Halogeometricum rufum]|uniref:Ribosomal RNA large subunit methyltransferase E n=2 Tax=Haloferacaceae TaxID=1644056 RepID=A0A1I6FZT5_9EURY|nr:23S rRNA Um-2552 2'-O-methyltransferase [Halogeometricum rufum]